MPKPRFSGGRASMRSSSSQMLPEESASSPAMQLSAVDLPQPEGPRRAMNSPRRMVTLRPSSAAISPRRPCANRRVTASRRSSLKSCLRLLGLLRPDLLVPDTERLDLRLGVERLGMRKSDQPLLVFRPAEFAQRLLAFLGRHRQRHVLDRRSGIEVALVIGQRLRLWPEEPGHEIEHD